MTSGAGRGAAGRADASSGTRRLSLAPTDAATGSAARRADAEAAMVALYQQVLDLEIAAAAREELLVALHTEVERLRAALDDATAELDARTAALDAAAGDAERLGAEKLELQHTKTFRWAAPGRAMWGRVLDVSEARGMRPPRPRSS